MDLRKQVGADVEVLRREVMELRWENAELGNRVTEATTQFGEAMVNVKLEVGKAVWRVAVVAVSGVVSALYLVKEMAASPMFAEGEKTKMVALTDELVEIIAERKRTTVGSTLDSKQKDPTVTVSIVDLAATPDRELKDTAAIDLDPKQRDPRTPGST